MTSFRWYLVDALIRWLVDNNCVPHVVIQCDLPGVQVPEEFVEDNRLVLNVSRQAVSNFSLGPEGLELDARFNGISHHVRAPAGAIVGVHAKGGSVGISLDPETSEMEQSQETSTGRRVKRTTRPKLEIVK